MGGERAASSPYANSSPASKLGPPSGPGTLRSPPPGSHRGRDTPAGVVDPTEDDPVEKDHHHHHHHGHSSGSNAPAQVVTPSITVRSEFSTIHRSQQTVQPLTCIVVVDLPSKRLPGREREEHLRSFSVSGVGADEGVYSYQQVREESFFSFSFLEIVFFCFDLYNGGKAKTPFRNIDSM